MSYPIKETVSCKYGLLKGIDLIKQEEVHAYVGADGSVIVATGTRPITAIERWRKKCSHYHIVDMSKNTFVTTFDLCSADSMKHFTVRADITISVDNPEMVVKSGVKFNNLELREKVKGYAKESALNHEIKDYHVFSSRIDRQAIEREIQNMGFKTESITVNIEPDESTRKIIEMQQNEEWQSYKKEIEFKREAKDIENQGKLKDLELKTKKGNMENLADVKISISEKVGEDLGDELLAVENKTFAASKDRCESKIGKLKSELKELREDHSKANKEDNIRLMEKLENRMDDISKKINQLEGIQQEERIGHKDIETKREKQKYHDTSDEYQ